MTLIGIAVIKWGIPVFKSYLNRLPAEDELQVLNIVLSISILSLIPWAIYFYRFGRKVIESNQYPPPGVKVIHDTLVLTDKAACRRGHIFRAAGLLIIITALLVSVYVPYMVNNLSHQRISGEKPNVAVHRMPQSVQAADPYKERYAGWVAEQLALLKVDVSLEQWKQSRPHESIILFRHGDAAAPSSSNWCARSESRIELGGGQSAIRYAYFYPPKAPESLALPSEAEASALVDKQCSLGLIWTERLMESSADGQENARSVREAIERRYGGGQSGTKMSFSGSASWSETGRWNLNLTTIVSAYSDWKHERYKSRVLAFAFLPISELHVDGRQFFNRGLDDESGSPMIRAKEMVLQSGIDGGARELMLEAISLMVVANQDTSLKKVGPYRQKVVKALQQWFAASHNLDVQHKVAALLVADQLLSMAVYSVAIADSEAGKQARQQLKQLGAQFDFFEPAGGYDYLDTWRQQAYKLHVDGPAGELALLMQLEDLFRVGYCAGKAKFTEAIQRGESYLRQEHEAKDHAAVRLMVADAYRDIVALAEGADDNVNQKEYSDLKDAARKNAIMHYRKALADSRLTRMTMHEWNEAWRLIAGVAPHNNYCWSD